MDNLSNTPIALSDCGQYFSYCTLDGQLKIWDTLSGQLKQEYTPSSHLSTTCVRIVWPNKQLFEPIVNSPKKKKKRKIQTNVCEEVLQLELLALGTIDGKILLYSVVKSDLHSQLINGHEDRVNDMSWLASNDSLFSCSNDKYVIEWSISSASIKQKFKPDRSNITAICAIDSSNILTASNCIKWWDWERKSLLKKFSGHSTEIQRIRHVNVPNSEVLGSYFLTSAVGDRLINAWQLRTEGDSNSLASFSLDDEPIGFDISLTTSTQPILVPVVTKSGSLHIFEHILNGHRKTPITPKKKIQISTQNSKKISSKQLMILSAQISNDFERQILLSYGNLIRPVFERFSYEKCDKNTTLLRKDTIELSTPSLDNSYTKIKTPLNVKNATVIGPAGMAPTRQSVTANNISNDDFNETKTAIKGKNELKLSIEERLQISDEKRTDFEPIVSSSQQPSSDSLTHVLVQGLQSRDKQMLETVLINDDEKLIHNTIKKLPIDCIALFLYELQSCLFNRSEHTLVYLKWLQHLLHLRLTFLMTLPNIEEEFGPLLELLNARTHILDRVYRLKGRLNLMISQIRAQNNTEYLNKQLPKIDYESSTSSSSDEDEDKFDEEINLIIDENRDNGIAQQNSSDESLDEDNDNVMSEDNYMSEENDDELSINVNEFETD